MDSAARWLWRVTGRKKGYVLALTLVQAVSGGLGVLYALLLRNIVDSAVGHDGVVFRHNVVLIVALVVLQITLSAIVRWINELARSDIENRFKQRLTDNILRKEYSAVSATHTAEWLNRLTNDTTVVANGIVEILPGLTGTIVRLVSAVIMVIALDRMFAAILVPGGIALCVLTYAFRRVLKLLHKNIQESDGQLRIFLQEHILAAMSFFYGFDPLQYFRLIKRGNEYREEAPVDLSEYLGLELNEKTLGLMPLTLKALKKPYEFIRSQVKVIGKFP